ncbi:MAG: DUF2807 domain-containing protein [Bacteroidetes bacterium]|nr:DUF2807 domain-containing protein [Bacteroidota bacterium]
MKKIIFPVFLFASTVLFAQSFEKKVGHFGKIIASPKINLVLVEGNEESVKIDYANVDPDKINVKVKHNKLHIYLDGSKFTEKQRRVQKDGWVNKESMYKNASITAYVTYKKLNKLVVRGEQEVDVQGAIANKKFKLSAYGECNITMASLQVDWFKAALYGQNTLKVKTGSAEVQKYKLFGENKIDTQSIQSSEITSSTYGESRLKLNAEENLKLWTFGESQVMVRGGAEVDKLTFGQVSIRKQPF